MKWGLFGGTFDPIHIGHLRCAEEILEMFNLNRIIFIPASRPPHKLHGEITPFYHRERMVKLAIESNPSFSFSDVENKREGASYSVETVEHILMENPHDLELYFIVGQDAFHAIRTWREWEKLLLMCHFIVMTRPGYENVGLDRILDHEFASQFVYDQEKDGFRGPTGFYIYFRNVTFLDIASRKIREWIREGRSITYLTSDPVCDYIIKNNLYQKP
ncbi:MAG: nicotinate-nucleotide adenylyltransferase [Syntrophus sp. SKADARSKE-3]|nr:nicotinate-nucleotide adenylyltransferase [Syntrophus sp. SKADARSKE-3]